MAKLLIGPLLRHVGERDASIWVETTEPCEVEVRAGDITARERTFGVAGHHYAIVVISGLEAASSTPYEVRVDGEPAWPLPDSEFPPSRIRTVDPSRPIRLIFGSCREVPLSPGTDESKTDPDVLDAFATRMALQPYQDWPDLLLFLGDQVYADETSAPMQEFIKRRRDIKKMPKAEVADFEEYTQLYLESWTVPRTRWLFSTTPTSMIFDDHDVRDDWNTSQAWRLDMQKTSWWSERITGALMSYWIYQHLGNLSPAGLEANETYQAVRGSREAEPILRKFAQAADREADGAKGTQWSYRRDFGPVRLLVIDSRCGRVLADGHRSMVSDKEFDWIEQQTNDGEFEHLVVATSMPWLLPRALHDIESWNEALAAGSRGRIMGRMAEWVRRAVDLEHWAAFRHSFDRLAALFDRVGRGADGRPGPATICVLSGDVHHTYVAEAEYPAPPPTRVYQITCSPIHNTIPRLMQLVFRVGWSRKAEQIVRMLDRVTRVPPVPIKWHHPAGPYFGNILALLTLDGPSARIRLEKATRRDASNGEDGHIDLTVVEDLPLTPLQVTP